MPNGRRLKQNRPKGVMKVVSSLESRLSGTCQKTHSCSQVWSISCFALILLDFHQRRTLEIHIGHSDTKTTSGYNKTGSTNAIYPMLNGSTTTAIMNTSPGEADTPVTVTPRQPQGATRLADTSVTVTPRPSQGTTRLAAQMPSTPCSTVQPQQQAPSQCYNHNFSGQQFTRYGRRIVKPVKLDL